MHDHRFDALTRSLTASGSRRRAVAAALGGALGVLGLPRSDHVSAGGKCKPKCAECKTCKNGKKGKQGKCKPKANGTVCRGGTCQGGRCIAATAPPPPPTCAETCRSTCESCFYRVGASTLCGGFPISNCNYPCSSDNDCIGIGLPYCLSHRVNRTTGTVRIFCEGTPTPGGFCVAIQNGCGL